MDEHGPVISFHDSLHLVSNKSAKPLPILAACVQPQNVEQICPQRFDSQCWLLAKDWTGTSGENCQGAIVCHNTIGP